MNDGSNIAGNKPRDMVEESKMGMKYSDPDLFPADKLIQKMGSNMAQAEALTDENPLWTPKTAELEAREREDES